MQEKAHCIIGVDYPTPILDEGVEKDRCIARIKNAYSLGLHGDSPEVMDGSAGEMLKRKHEGTGAGKVKDKEEREEKKREKGGKRAGDGNLDGFVKRGKR